MDTESQPMSGAMEEKFAVSGIGNIVSCGLVNIFSGNAGFDRGDRSKVRTLGDVVYLLQLRVADMSDKETAGNIRPIMAVIGAEVDENNISFLKTVIPGYPMRNAAASFSRALPKAYLKSCRAACATLSLPPPNL